MTITIKQTVYEPIPEGLYPATITSIEEEPNGKFGPQLLVKFSLDPFKDYPDGKELRAWCSAKFSAKSKLYAWTRAVLGNIPPEYDFDSDDLLKKRVMLSVGQKERDGMIYDQIEDVKPLRAVARPPDEPGVQKTLDEVNAALEEVDAVVPA